MRKRTILLLTLVSVFVLFSVFAGAFFLGYRGTLAYQARNGPTTTSTAEAGEAEPVSTGVLNRDDDERIPSTPTPVDNSPISRQEVEALFPFLENAEEVTYSKGNTHIEYVVDSGLSESFDSYVQALESQGWEVEKSQEPTGETGIAILTATNGDGYTVSIQMNKAKQEFKLMVTIDLSGVE